MNETLRTIDRDEIEAVLTGDPKKTKKTLNELAAMLKRAAHTIGEHQATIDRLHATIENNRTKTAKLGRASTLNPIDAARYLSATQLEQIFEPHMQERLKTLAATRRQVQSELEQVKYMIAEILTDDSLLQQTRDRITEILETLPTEQP